MNPLFHTECSISDSLKSVRKSVLIYETIIKNTTGFITNVINVTVSSANTEVQFLIDELKKTYNTFIKQFEKKEA